MYIHNNRDRLHIARVQYHIKYVYVCIRTLYDLKSGCAEWTKNIISNSHVIAPLIVACTVLIHGGFIVGGTSMNLK